MRATYAPPGGAVVARRVILAATEIKHAPADGRPVEFQSMDASAVRMVDANPPSTRLTLDDRKGFVEEAAVPRGVRCHHSRVHRVERRQVVPQHRDTTEQEHQSQPSRSSGLVTRMYHSSTAPPTVMPIATQATAYTHTA